MNARTDRAIELKHKITHAFPPIIHRSALVSVMQRQSDPSRNHKHYMGEVKPVWNNRPISTPIKVSSLEYNGHTHHLKGGDFTSYKSSNLLATKRRNAFRKYNKTEDKERARERKKKVFWRRKKLAPFHWRHLFLRRGQPLFPDHWWWWTLLAFEGFSFLPY